MLHLFSTTVNCKFLLVQADEMGLGKTIQAAGFIMALKHENLSNKPVLVIGPKSTLVGWEQVGFLKFHSYSIGSIRLNSSLIPGF